MAQVPNGTPDADGGPGYAWQAALDSSAAERAAAGLRREPRPRGADERTIDLAGNDYLGLSRHPAVLAAVVQALRDYGLGATGSRLVRGSTRAHAALETELAAWLGTDTALVFSSGYLANLAAIRALAGRDGALIVSDAHNHASIVDGCRLAARDGAVVRVVPHADPAAVEAALAAHTRHVHAGSAASGAVPSGSACAGPAVVVTESVYSVDGDLAPLRRFHTVARAHGAVLLVDDAHAAGLLGPAGAGAVAAAGLAHEPDVVVTLTLSKAFGGAGGVVAGPAALHRHLVDTGRTFIYDTALPPPVAAGALAALDVIRTGDRLRAEVADRATQAVRRLGDAGLDVSRPAAGVIAVAAPGPAAAVAWAAACARHGVAVGCFRPPSTPDGRSRLRLTINAGVPRDGFTRALDIIVREKP